MSKSVDVKLKFDANDCSDRLHVKDQLKYGDIVSLVVQNREMANDDSSNTAFVSTLQNMLYASARLTAYHRSDITRPFALVATFLLCAVCCCPIACVEPIAQPPSKANNTRYHRTLVFIQTG